MQTGDQAPDFTLPDQDGNRIPLSERSAGGMLVVFFYPRDGTHLCTREAGAFRDHQAEFQALGAKVIGVSSDTAEAHRRFADQNQLAFPLLEDEGGRMRKAWCVPRTMGILPGRVTYVLDSSLVVHSIFNSQLEPSRHVEAALAVLDRLDRRPASRRRHRTRKSGK